MVSHRENNIVFSAMEATPLSHSRPVQRNRCGCCRQVGHNRTRCPHDDQEASRLRQEFRDSIRAQRRRDEARVVELVPAEESRFSAVIETNTTGTEQEFRRRILERVNDMRSRLNALTTDGAPVRRGDSGPTVRESKVQEILFDHCQEIPEGLYKELMDALVLRN